MKKSDYMLGKVWVKVKWHNLLPIFNQPLWKHHKATSRIIMGIKWVCLIHPICHIVDTTCLRHRPITIIITTNMPSSTTLRQRGGKKETITMLPMILINILNSTTPIAMRDMPMNITQLGISFRIRWVLEFYDF